MLANQKYRAHCRRRTNDAVPRAEKFSHLITADHKVLNEEGESQNNHLYAVVVQDLATQWIQSYPCKTKTTKKTEKSLRKFLEPLQKPKDIHTDNSLEFGESCEKLSWNHGTSTPHRCETNGIATKSTWRNFSRTDTIRIGWKMVGWSCGMLLLPAKCPGRGANSPNERRVGKTFKGPVILFGAMVEYHPIWTRDQSRLHQFGKKVLPGILLGNALIAGEFGKETFRLRTLSIWEDGSIRN